PPAPAAPLPPRRRAARPGARVSDQAEADAAAGLAHLNQAAEELMRRIARGSSGPRVESPDGRVTVGDGKNGIWDEVKIGARATLRGSFVNGEREGLWVETDAEGGRSETEYHLGLKSGRSAAWRADGTPRFLGTYSADDLVGTWTAWHASGYLISTREFVAGKVTGPVREYHPNGVLMRESFYEDGKDIAATTGWYDDGALEYVMPYTCGKRWGEAVWYHPNGVVSARGTYVDDVLDGPYRTFDTSGIETCVELWDHGSLVSKVVGDSALAPASTDTEGREQR
ncbi:MAG: hypothetical protein K8T90_17580, partial [Planctomycetes bacterium]|nr:hypothetical protein [Planctomycetota bacterium]